MMIRLKLAMTALTAVLIGSFPASEACADQTLTTFEQEIIHAKEKHQSVSEKMEAAQLYLDEEKAKMLQAEAEKMMGSMTAGGYGSQEAPEAPPEIGKTVPDKAVREIRIAEPEKKTPLLKKILWFLPKKEAPAASSVPEEEIAYKVAVSDGEISMKEAIDIGLAGNLDLQSLKKKVEVAEAKVVEAKRARFPTIQAVTEENGGIAGDRFYRGRNYKLNVTQPLYYGGELILTVKQAETNLKSAKVEYAKARGDYIQQVRSAYYGVVKAEYNLQYQTALYEKMNGLYKRVKEEYRQKLAPEIDFLNAESSFYQVLFQADSARNDLQSSIIVLRQTLNLVSDNPMPVDLRLKYSKVNPVFEEILDMALKYNPEIKIKKLALDSAEYGVGIFQAKKKPRIDLRGSYGLLGEVHKDTRAIRADNHDLDLEKEWFVTVEGSMPLGPNTVSYSQTKHVYGPTVIALTGSEDWRHRVAFNLFDKFSDITDEKSAQATLLQAQSDYKKAKMDVTLKVRDGFYNIRKSMIQIDSAIAKVRYQEKQNGILEYMIGMQETTLEELLEGWIEQAQNRFSFIQAVTDYDLALSELGVEIGDPFYFEGKEVEDS